MTNFEKIIEVRWADVDHNQHVRHSAYYDFGAHVRIRFFETVDYSSQVLQKLHLGPILFEESCAFIREIRLDDTLRVNLLRGPMREDASHWTLYHEIFNQREEKVAQIRVKGAWMDLQKRKITVPPHRSSGSAQSPGAG